MYLNYWCSEGKGSMENTKRGIPRIYKGNYSKTLNFKKTISKFADERFRIYEAVFFKSSQGHK